MANELAILFQAHDRGHRDEAVDACKRVDSLQFQYLDPQEVAQASTALVDALWAKDDVELAYLTKGGLDREGLREADYSDVVRHLWKRAVTIGADPAYADLKALAWRRHKTGGDYWTPYQQAQLYEFRAALQDPGYPNKPRYGIDGPGPEPMRYVLASELHDMRSEAYVQQGRELLVPYFARILEAYEHESN